jgi:isopenicillin-N epimerase
MWPVAFATLVNEPSTSRSPMTKRRVRRITIANRVSTSSNPAGKHRAVSSFGMEPSRDHAHPHAAREDNSFEHHRGPGSGETASSRRGLLLGAGVLAASVAGVQAPSVSATTISDYRSWAALRAAFPLSRNAVHLQSFLCSPHPKPVEDAIQRYRRALAPDPEGYLFDQETAQDERSRLAASRYLGASPDEVALTDSTTMGLGVLYGGLRLSPGDEIVTTTQDFYSTHEALRLRALRTGASLKEIALYRDVTKVSVDELVSSVSKGLTHKTRVLALTWVHSSTGLKLPLEEIAAVVNEANRSRDEEDRVLLCVDAVHGFGNQDVDGARLGADFFVSGCHKWLFGPRGTGVVWGRRSAWKRTSPIIPSFDPRSILNWIEPRAHLPVRAGAAMTPGGIHSFEHRWALADAFKLHDQVGRARVADRTLALATQMKDGLAETPGVTLRTPRSPTLSAGLVCFELATLDAPSAVEALRRKRILASVTPYAAQYIRVGPSIVNTPEEVDETLRAVRSL